MTVSVVAISSYTLYFQVLWCKIPTLYLTVISADPDTAWRPSSVKATDRTLSVCPSNVFRTPAVSRSQLLRVLSQDEETMQSVAAAVFSLMTGVAATQEMALRCPFIVTRRGPPGRDCRGCRGVRGDWKSSRAALTKHSRMGLCNQKNNLEQFNVSFFCLFFWCIVELLLLVTK